MRRLGNHPAKTAASVGWVRALEQVRVSLVEGDELFRGFDAEVAEGHDAIVRGRSPDQACRTTSSSLAVTIRPWRTAARRPRRTGPVRAAFQY